MLKGQFRYIAVAAFGAGAVLLASGAGSHLLALQGSSPTVRAHASDDLAQASPAPTLSPVPAAITMPANPAPVTVLATAPALDDDAVEDAQGAGDAAEGAEAAEPNDLLDDNGRAVAGAPAGQPLVDDHGHDGRGPGGSDDGHSG
jgi:hypothetical protein